jgi:membrane protein DedA with SNARE-associated domain
MDGIEQQVTTWLIEVSHYPFYLYLGVALFFTASSFGFPIPEEVVLVTCGMIAYLSLEEARAQGTTPTVNAVSLALHCFASVFLSDLLVFFLGRRYGTKLLRRPPFTRLIGEGMLNQVETSVQKYGAFACGLFRFTPALRFPGHFMCGALKISYPKFLITDGLAALISVPTQVLLLAYYSKEVLVYFNKFKVVIIGLLVLLVLIWLVKRIAKWIAKWIAKRQPTGG